MPDLKGLDNVHLILAFIVPGLVALYCRAQFLTGRMPAQVDAVLPCLALSFVYYALVFPVVEHMPSRGPAWFAALAWFALVFAGPALFGAVLGIATQKGWGRRLLHRVLRRLSLNVVHQMPTAWDWKLCSVTGEWVIVELKDGTKYFGWFGGNSFAASDGRNGDIYIQEIFDVADDTNKWTTRGSAVLIAAGEIRSIEFIPEEAVKP